MCDNDMWIYDQEPDYDNHICPLAGVSNYCIYGHGEACSTCEALLAYDKYCEDIIDNKTAPEGLPPSEA